MHLFLVMLLLFQMLSLTRKKTLIEDCRLLTDLNATEIEMFCALGREQKRESGTFFWHEEDSATHFAILLSGEVKLSQLSAEGQVVIVDYLSPGDGFGIIAALGEFNYPVSAEAVHDSTALTWDKESTKTLMLQIPQLALNGMALLSNRLVGLQTRLRELATERVEQRIARTLLRMVNQFGKRIDEGILIDIPMSQKDLADMTSTTIYTVSRVLNKWQQMELISIGRQRLVLVNPHKLVLFADGKSNE